MLVSAMMLTLGLSLSKKTTIETKIDTNEELLKKAFNAAESGISYYLGTGKTDYVAPDGFSSAALTLRNITANGQVLDFGEYIPKNETEFFWLVNHLANGSLGATYYGAATIQLCGVGFTGSAKVDYFYRSGANFGVKRYGYNFGSVASQKVHGFTDTATNCVTINTPNSALLMAVTPLFNGGRLYLQGAGGGTFPVQGVEINSVGRAGGAETEVNAAQVNKSLSVKWRYKIPAFMLSGIVSEDSVLSD